MKTFEELYKDVLSRKISLKEPLPSEYNPLHLDCLLHPKNYAPVIPSVECEECAYERACQRSCIFDAIEEGEDGKLRINPSLCTGCGVCMDACKEEKLTAQQGYTTCHEGSPGAKGPGLYDGSACISGAV